MTSQEGATLQQQREVDVTATKSSDDIALSSPALVEPEEEKNSEAKSQEPTNPPSNPRLQALAAKKTNLEATLASLHAERSTLVASARLPSGLAMPDAWSEEEKTKSALATANAVIKEHIALLHKYNEIKDIGQGLMGLIADKRGVRVASVMEEFGMEEKD